MKAPSRPMSSGQGGSPAPAHRSALTSWAVFALIGVGLAWLAYRGMAGQAFLYLWDDSDLNNPKLHGFGWENLRWMVSTFEGSNWKPLTWLSLSVDYALWGENPLGYKLHNLALHFLSSVLVALLIERLVGLSCRREGRSTAGVRYAAQAAGLLFLVHPQHVESVVWVSERKDVLFALFYLGALYTHVRAMDDPRTGSWAELTKASAFLSMLAKPMAVSLPVALVLLDLYLERPRGWAETRRVLAASVRRNLVVFAMAAVVAWIITRAVEVSELPTPLGLAARVANASFAVLFYGYGFVLPFDLSPYYPFPDWILSLSGVAAVAPLILLGVLALAVAGWRRGLRAPLLLLLFAGVTLFPASGIKQVIFLTYADRFVYIPGLPLYLAFALLLTRLWALPPRPLAGVVLASLALLALETARHVGWWQDDEAMWRRVVERDPGKVALAYHRLAHIARTRGEPAGELYRAALDAEPWNPTSRLLLAQDLLRTGRVAEAQGLLVSMVRERPDLPQHAARAVLFLVESGGLELAQEAVQRALAAQPDHLVLLTENARVRALRGVPLDPAELGHWVAVAESGPYDQEATRHLASVSSEGDAPAPADLVAVWQAFTRNPAFRLSGAEELAWLYHQLGTVQLRVGQTATESFGRSFALGGDVSMGLAQVTLLTDHALYCEARAHLNRIVAGTRSVWQGGYDPQEIARRRAFLEERIAAAGGGCADGSGRL